MKLDLNRFDDIQHVPLRVFNRAVLMSNLRADGGEEAARLYAEQFDEVERKQMYLMFQYISVKGVEAARKAATKDLKIVEAA